MAGRNLALFLLAIIGAFVWLVLSVGPPISGPPSIASVNGLTLTTAIVSPKESRVVLPTGFGLGSFFDGLAPDPRFTVERLVADKVLWGMSQK